MRMRSYAVGAMVGAVLSVVAATGCSTTAGTPVTATVGSPAPAPAATSSVSPPSVAPTGEPVGTAVMKVSGGSAPVTIRYRINGGPEQTETDVTLPWEKQYPVYDELESEVAADGGAAELTCSIFMSGDMLVSFKTEPRPVCNFAYWG